MYNETQLEGMEPPNPLPSGLFNNSCFYPVLHHLLKGSVLILARSGRTLRLRLGSGNGSRLCVFDGEDRSAGAKAGGSQSEQFAKLGDADAQVPTPQGS